MKERLSYYLIDKYFGLDRHLYKFATGTIKNQQTYFGTQINATHITLNYAEDQYSISPVRQFTFKRPNSYRYSFSYLFSRSYDSNIDDHLAIISFGKKNEFIEFHQFRQNDIEESGFINYRFSYNEFFGCLSSVKKINDLKGIMSVGEKLFVFFGQKYMKIKEPSKFISNNFRLTQMDYANASSLKNFIDFDLNDLKFETNRTKYFKSSSSHNFLTLYEDTFRITEKDDQLYFTKTDLANETFVARCHRLILTVDNYAFCFENDEYFPLGKIFGCYI